MPVYSFVGTVKGSFSHKSVPHRSVDLLGKQPDLVSGIGQVSAPSHQDKGLFRVFDHHQGKL